MTQQFNVRALPTNKMGRGPGPYTLRMEPDGGFTVYGANDVPIWFVTGPQRERLAQQYGPELKSLLAAYCWEIISVPERDTSAAKRTPLTGGRHDQPFTLVETDTGAWIENGTGTVVGSIDRTQATMPLRDQIEKLGYKFIADTFTRTDLYDVNGVPAYLKVNDRTGAAVVYWENSPNPVHKLEPVAEGEAWGALNGALQERAKSWARNIGWLFEHPGSRIILPASTQPGAELEALIDACCALTVNDAAINDRVQAVVTATIRYLKGGE